LASEAAERIAAAHRNGQAIPRLDPLLRPADVAAAYLIQDDVAAVLGPIAGWKVGRNPTDGLDTCAPLFRSRIFSGGPAPTPASLLGTALEIEFAFRVGADLLPREESYTLAEVAEAIDAFVPLVELVGGRFLDRPNLSPPEQLADGYGAAVFVGTPVADWSGLDFAALRAELRIDGKPVQSACDAHPAGNPLLLVVWLANHLARRPAAGGLKRGQIVTTGGLAGVTAVTGGEQVEARYYARDGQILAEFGLVFGLPG
jgi:2-keto-4-pentenoate hydratase